MNIYIYVYINVYIYKCIYIYLYIYIYIWRFQVDGKPHRQIAILFLIWQVACCLGYGWCEMWVFYRVMLWPNPSIASPKTLPEKPWLEKGLSLCSGAFAVSFRTGSTLTRLARLRRKNHLLQKSCISWDQGLWSLQIMRYFTDMSYLHVWIILLVVEILHQLIGSLSHYLQGFLHTRWLCWNFFHQQYQLRCLFTSNWNKRLCIVYIKFFHPACLLALLVANINLDIPILRVLVSWKCPILGGDQSLKDVPLMVDCLGRLYNDHCYISERLIVSHAG